MKPLNLFFFSATLFFLANNFYFVSNNAFIPRFFDLIATIALIVGFMLRFKTTSNQTRK